MGADDSTQPGLAEAEVWAVAHRDLLARTFERFREAAEWPNLEELQHDFTVAGSEADIASLAHSIPRPLGLVEQGRFVLLVRGLSYVEAATGLLRVWAESLHLACQRWIDDPKTAWLTREDVEKLTGGDRRQTDLVSLILLRERWPFGDGQGLPAEDWRQKVIDTVRIARYGSDPDVLLQKRAALEYPQRSPQAELTDDPRRDLSAASPPGHADDSSEEAETASGRVQRSRIRRIFEHPYAVVIIGGVVVLLIWAILSDGFNGIFRTGSGDRSTEAGRTNKQGGSGQESHSGQVPGGQVPGDFEETAAEGGASTYANPHTLSKPGPAVEPGQEVRVICRVYAPEPPSVNPDGYWYRLASLPWNGNYFAPANSFWNGDTPGQRPYTHNTDKRVPAC